MPRACVPGCIATCRTPWRLSRPLGGSATKRRLLTIENARLDGPADLFDSVEADVERAARA
jgi:hypothetical protein